MDTNKNLFLQILQELNKNNVLQDLIIIGGWCLIIYREQYGNPSTISALRTSDVDFLVSLDQKFQTRVDIGQIFSNIGLEEKFSITQGYIKYVHPDLEVEFLVPMLGRQVNTPFTLNALKTNAQRLRFLDILVKYSKLVDYCNLKVRVPEPAAYVINKLIASSRRDNPLKASKDLKSAKELGEYILVDEVQRNLLKSIYSGYKTNIKKKIANIVKLHSQKIYDLITE